MASRPCYGTAQRKIAKPTTTHGPKHRNRVKLPALASTGDCRRPPVYQLTPGLDHRLLKSTNNPMPTAGPAKVAKTTITNDFAAMVLTPHYKQECGPTEKTYVIFIRTLTNTD